MLSDIKSKIHSTTGSIPYTLLSQSIRITGAAASIALCCLDPNNRFAQAALGVAAVAPSLRLPFYVGQAVDKSLQALEKEEWSTERVAYGMGALYLGTRSLQVGLQLVPSVSVLASFATAVGVAISLIKFGRVGLSAKRLLDRRRETGRIDRGNLIRLLSKTLFLGGGFVLAKFVSSHYYKLVKSSRSFITGLNTAFVASLELDGLIVS